MAKIADNSKSKVNSCVIWYLNAKAYTHTNTSKYTVITKNFYSYTQRSFGWVQAVVCPVKV